MIRAYLVHITDASGRREMKVLAAHSVDAVLFVLGEFPAARRISARVA